MRIREGVLVASHNAKLNLFVVRMNYKVRFGLLIEVAHPTFSPMVWAANLYKTQTHTYIIHMSQLNYSIKLGVKIK